MLIKRFAMLLLAACAAFGGGVAHADAPGPATSVDMARVKANIAPDTAATCTTVRLDQANGPVSGMPIYSQAFGSCFAVAGTELIDAWRFSHASKSAVDPHHFTSALVAADGLGVALNRDTRKIGGSIDDVVNFVRANGSCSQDALFGPYFEFYGPGQEWFEGMVKGAYTAQDKWNHDHSDWLADHLRAIEKAHPDWSVQHAVAQAEYDAAAVSDSALGLCRIVYNPLPDPFKSQVNPAAMLAALLAQSGSGAQAVTKYYQHACALPGNTLKVDVPAPKTVVTNGSLSVIQALNDRLSMPNPQPIALGICSDSFKIKGYEGAMPDKDPMSDQFCKHPDQHEVIVIGRQFNNDTGKCEFVIRNSWGTNCGAYNPDPKSQPAPTPAKWACDNRGQITMDPDAMAKSVFAYSYLDGK